MTKPILQLHGLSKRFGMTQALDNVSLDLFPGEIHALLGENGAGKSTLIKAVTGIYKPDQGGITFKGKPVNIPNSLAAQRLGIAAIHQEPMIFPDLNVAENIFISHQNRGLIVNWNKMYAEATALLKRLGIGLDVRSLASGLTLAEQQAVEIAKAISLDVQLLIMDEPTASLSAHEVDRLFQITQGLKEAGVSILFISHRLEEVFTISDRITVMRDGQVVSTAVAAEVTPESAIRDMVGREVGEFFVKSETKSGQRLMVVHDLSKDNVFSNINFEIHAGEVLGFAGLVGSRRTDVGLALFGIEPADSGSIVLEKKAIAVRSPQEAVAHGIAYVTEDRRQLGLSMPMSIATNITLPILRDYANRWGLIRRKQERETAETFRKRLAIRTPSIDLEVGKLSGGNQQKVMLSKWLNTQPKLLILDEPTRGVDVGAKAEVHHFIDDLAAQGIGIILISSDLPEVLAMSDRVLVMREGRQMGIFDREEATQERVMTAAMGQSTHTGNTA